MTDGWRLVHEGAVPEEEPLCEALCTLGNGRFATRGAPEWTDDDGSHYPGSYLAGGYDRLTSDVAGRDIVNEDLVNVPNWLPLTFSPEGGVEIGDPANEILDVRTELDLLAGILSRAFTVRDPAGRETRVASRRLVSMADPYLAAISMEILPLNWVGPILVRSGLDGTVTNHGVARYRDLRGDHLSIEGTGTEDDGIIWLRARMKQSGLGIYMAARTSIAGIRGRASEGDRKVEATFEVEAAAGCSIHVEKTVCLHTDRDPALGDRMEDVLLGVRRAPECEELEAQHSIAWTTLWDRYDVEIDVSPEIELSPHSIQLILRLHTFHMLQSAGPHTIGLDVSIGARGLHGEAYRGHIFWDEMYIFPFYLYRDPELARSLLLYRYHRLPEARAAALDDGRAGAMFPWQSGSSGREETQIIHLNPESGTWGPDYSHLQRHISAAIAVNVWSYVEATGDLDFLESYGAELLIEIARFWASMTSEREDGRFEIIGVMGPDEFHEAYADADEGGVRNNAYTNVMASWCIDRAIESLQSLDEVARSAVEDRLALSEEEMEQWRAVIDRMTIPVMPNGLIAQFEGYEDLIELDWDAYRAKYDAIGRLDRILKAEGDSPDRYKLSKQADLCMLFYVLEQEELSQLLERSGYKLTKDVMLETIEYYRRRTSHGSTLSHLVFAAILDDLDREASWTHFVEALRSDVEDVQGGTTPEGIHAAVMAGTIRHVIERFAGFRMASGELRLHPCLPEGVERIRFAVRWRGVHVRIEVGPVRLAVEIPEGATRDVPIRVNGRVWRATPGESLAVEYSS